MFLVNVAKFHEFYSLVFSAEHACQRWLLGTFGDICININNYLGTFGDIFGDASFGDIWGQLTFLGTHLNAVLAGF